MGRKTVVWKGRIARDWMVITHNRARIGQTVQFKWLNNGAICMRSSRLVIKDHIEMTMHL